MITVSRSRAGALFILLLLPIVAASWFALSDAFTKAAYADAERSLAALMNQADRLAFDLDLELSLFDSLLSRRNERGEAPRAAAVAALEAYRAQARWPGLLRSLYLVERRAGGATSASLIVDASGRADAAEAAGVLGHYSGDESVAGQTMFLARSVVFRGERDPADQGASRSWGAGLVVALIDEAALHAAMAELGETYFGRGTAFSDYGLVLRDAQGGVRIGTVPSERERPDFSRPLVRDSGRFDLPRFYLSFASGIESPPDGAPSGGRAALELAPPELPPGTRVEIRRLPVPDEGSPAALIDRYRFQIMDARGFWSLELYRRGLPLAEAALRDARLSALWSAGLLALLYGCIVALYWAARRTRELAARERAFVASVTHELKTPIAVALSAGENLAKGIVAPDRVGAYGEAVARESRRLADSVERLLLVAGLEASGDGSGRHGRGEALDLGQLAREAAAALSPLASERGATIELELDAPGGVRPLADGSRPLVAAAIQGVIGNAVRYAGGRIRVRAWEERRGGRKYAILRCDDEGPGIKRDERRRVFEPFYRGSGALASGSPGTGIGLYLARRSARLFGGDARLIHPAGGGLGVELSFRSYV